MIIPDGLTFIDFLEVHDEFYKVGKELADIHETLTTGLAIIAIQKRQGSETSIGGQITTDKPRLVVTLEETDSPAKIAKLTKVKKATVREDNPEGKQIDYVVSATGKLKALTGWRYMSERERKIQNEVYSKSGVVVPKKATEKYLFCITTVDGTQARITDKTVTKWEESYPSVNVRWELERVSSGKKWLKEKGWMFQLSGLLSKEQKRNER